MLHAVRRTGAANGLIAYESTAVKGKKVVSGDPGDRPGSWHAGVVVPSIHAKAMLMLARNIARQNKNILLHSRYEIRSPQAAPLFQQLL